MLKSADLYKKACNYTPGGVNSPVRSFKGVGGNPIFFQKGHGPYLWDVENNRYIDYVSSWGPLILGHAHPAVLSALKAAMDNGLSFGAATPHEVELAELICQLIPSMEMVRMVNSGTEATLTALRLARAYTKRDKIVKFTGCYHGHHDALLVKAGSGLMTLGIADSAGIPAGVVENTLVVDYNDIEQVQAIFQRYGQEIAAVIVEPIAGNMGCVPPAPGFLAALRSITQQYQSLLIFDEVITGFRVGLGGAQALYDIKPDLTTLGKIIGGGLPVGAIGGAKAIMEYLAPLGPVYQAGTLSGNPMAMTAGLATLRQLQKPGFYEQLAKMTDYLLEGMLAIAKRASVPVACHQVGSMFSLYFTDQAAPNNYQEVMQTNAKLYQPFFHGMLNQGVYFAPSAFETSFISAVHSDVEIQKTLTAAQNVFPLLANI